MIDELLQVGKLLESNAWRGTIEVRSVVDDDFIVTRRWSKARGVWIYEVERREYFEVILRKRHLREATTK